MFFADPTNPMCSDPVAPVAVVSTSIVLCAGVTSETVVIVLMALAFFGKGLGSLGWTIVSGTSPTEAAGIAGGLFNTVANLAGITTPIVIGYLVEATDSFASALVFVGVSGLAAVLAFLAAGPIRRITLAPVEEAS